MSDQSNESDWPSDHSSLLTHRVAEGVSALIHSGDLRDGERLPPIRELARRYETSFATARVALGRLEKLGLVQRFHGSGTYVRHRPKASSKSMDAGWAALFLDGRPQIGGRLSQDVCGLLETHGIVGVHLSWAGEMPLSHIDRLLRHGAHPTPPRAVVISGVGSQRDRAILNAVPPTTRIIAVLRSAQFAPSTWHSVNPDYFTAFKMAAELALKEGHRRVGIVVKTRVMQEDWRQTHRKAWMPSTQMILGAGEALREAGIHGGLSIHYNVPVGNDPSGIPIDEMNVERMATWLKSPNRPTAIIGEDFRLFGVIRAARRIGLRVPEDLMLAGVGGTFLTEIADFPCVSMNYDLMAKHIARLITADDQEFGGAAQHIAVPPKLVEQR